MDSKDVIEFSENLFQKFSTEEEAKEQFLFAKALQNNAQFKKDVEQEFFDRVREICQGDDHQVQKCAFRKLLIENIRNMIMWQEYFKRDNAEEGRDIFAFFEDSYEGVSFEEFEKQSAYFQLYSEALYSLIQCVLNKFYDEITENNYSAMLSYVYRLYYKQLFQSILARKRGEEDPEADVLGDFDKMLGQIEEPALKGEERAYDMSKL